MKIKNVLLAASASLFLFGFSHTSINSNQKSTTAIMKGNEEKEILKTLELYAEGARQHNSAMTAQAFAPEATMSWSDNGHLKSVGIKELYDIIDKKGPFKVTYEVTSIDIAGSVALVRIESQFNENRYTDMFSMVKDGSSWKILSKVYLLK
ncbi:nuclear transport factor 2 family protein [Flavobacterium aquidurense]|uniref:nuclear transport factor 2 family protein n=1 Tax=Flavobacterium aquidurense TaxID=362413 RepID=UPI0037568BFE